MQDLIRKLAEEFGDPITACAAGYQFYHWKPIVEDVSFVIYLTVFQRGETTVGYATVLCEADHHHVFTGEVGGAHDKKVIDEAVQTCIGRVKPPGLT